MIETAAATGAGNAEAYLLVLAIILPVGGVLLSFLLGSRQAERIVLCLLPLGMGIAGVILADVWRSGKALTYVLGGWTPPLGIMLRADGLSAAMLVTTAIIIAAAAFFARAKFSTPRDTNDERAPLAFWTLLLAVWAALNAVVLGYDLFNLYVALELLTFGAVPLVSLDGRAETLTAALRYLLFALVGSMFYLLGAALLYGTYGTLDIGLLASRVRPEPAVYAAGVLMTAGLLAKTALFPLYLWLPPAHAGAPAAASAVLSALVVKGSFFLVVRIWFDALPGIFNAASAQVLGALGAGAIIFGSLLALQQPRLKMVVAYSTVAQIGYLFLMFPLIIGTASGMPWTGDAWTGGWMQLFSHAFAKAAMFLAAGLIAEALGHDRIADLGGIGRALPMTTIAFALAGLSLMGIPPTGGFVAKWMLLTASAMEGQWWWALVILTGGLLAGAYMFRILVPAMAEPRAALQASVLRHREMVPLALAVVALLLGLVPLQPMELLQIGRPASLQGAAP
ncbi:complex I subunit 5 family protein [Hyphomicrobium sp.]|uniref:complex I subunit 5 family protein n=1 Tax=Hyphomicrobium sp. TaxID=82 RepID=UPI002E34D43E|nr:proton-conducting transporter membrane subunit [Hyphomicrobium sp.]HEX2840485.1 proton-conducting transporter membrane subunit [Hyphomicrobium sp.]